MPIKYIRVVPVMVFPLGNFRSLPAEVGTSAPLNPVPAPRRFEYPQEMTLTCPDLVIPPREPTSDSTFAFCCDPPGGKTKAMPMSPSESQMQKSIHGIPVPPALAEEIEQALEMMRRVRTAHLAQGKGEAVELPRTKYMVPKPLVYPVSRSSDRE
jgi:hypothetical protein